MALDKSEDPVASDAQLVSLSLQDESSDAFSELVQRYTGMVIGATTAILGNRDEAEDAAQEVFVKAYQSLAQLKEHNRFSSWLMAIASNTARSRGARKRPVSLGAGELEEAAARVPGVAQETPDEQMAREELQGQILAAMEDLPRAYRGTIYLRCLKGHTCREIAEIEGVSIGVVTSRLSRAYDMLRTKLRPVLRNMEGRTS